MANAAFFQYYPLPDNLTQNPVPTIQQLMEKVRIHVNNYWPARSMY